MDLSFVSRSSFFTSKIVTLSSSSVSKFIGWVPLLSFFVIYLANDKTSSKTTAGCDTTDNRNRNYTNCSNSAQSTRLQRRSTAIGRLSIRSQTVNNPAVPIFFLALSSKYPYTFSSSSFASLWTNRNMPSLHPRFHATITPPYTHLNNLPSIDMKNFLTDRLPYQLYRTDLRKFIEHLLL